METVTATEVRDDGVAPSEGQSPDAAATVWHAPPNPAVSRILGLRRALTAPWQALATLGGISGGGVIAPAPDAIAGARRGGGGVHASAAASDNRSAHVIGYPHAGFSRGATTVGGGPNHSAHNPRLQHHYPHYPPYHPQQQQQHASRRNSNTASVVSRRSLFTVDGLPEPDPASALIIELGDIPAAAYATGPSLHLLQQPQPLLQQQHYQEQQRPQQQVLLQHYQEQQDQQQQPLLQHMHTDGGSSAHRRGSISPGPGTGPGGDRSYHQPGQPLAALPEHHHLHQPQQMPSASLPLPSSPSHQQQQQQQPSQPHPHPHPHSHGAHPHMTLVVPPQVKAVVLTSGGGGGGGGGDGLLGVMHDLLGLSGSADGLPPPPPHHQLQQQDAAAGGEDASGRRAAAAVTAPPAPPEGPWDDARNPMSLYYDPALDAKNYQRHQQQQQQQQYGGGGGGGGGDAGGGGAGGGDDSGNIVVLDMKGVAWESSGLADVATAAAAVAAGGPVLGASAAAPEGGSPAGPPLSLYGKAQEYFHKWRGVSDTMLPMDAPLDMAWTWLGAFLAISVVALLNQYLSPHVDTALMVASFGASAVLLFGVPASKLGQPRNLLGGQVFSAIVGVLVRLIFRRAPELLWLSSALGMSLALLVMQLTRTVHPPGGATALIAASAQTVGSWLGFRLVLTVFFGSLAMLAVALLVNNISPRRRYPTYWVGA